VVVTTVTGAAPHHLIADAEVIDHRRTTAGDAHEEGRKVTTNVGLGMPAIGMPPPQPATSGCDR
jgi:tRNA-2-methylthio-N6-dimethylallyladenosine synthase